MEPFVDDVDFQLYVGDVRDVLAELPDESVDCCATSPPFYGLRDYGVEGQIGLEASPEDWCAELVGVFREVRRLLKPAGTLWIECGDSYVGSRNGPQGETGQMASRQIGRARAAIEGRSRLVDGCKPKDLIGTPWLLAKALRGPWYIGRIKKEIDRVWLAAMVDAEGCIHIHRRKAGRPTGSKFTRRDGTTVNYERRTDTYGAMVGVSNTSRAIVEKCKSIYGLGSISAHEAGTGKQQRKQTLYQWQVTGDQARDLLRELYPHLVAKQQQARVALACPRSGDAAADHQEAIKALHAGAAVDLDGKDPESMWEPGFYLRQCIVWGKPNAMPESATDRCTTAHSYVFLLSKSARYHFDTEAIAEPAEWARWGDQTVPKYEGTETASGWMQPKTKAQIRAIDAFGRKRGADARDGRTDVKGEREVPNVQIDGRKNPRSVWTIPTQGYPEAHFATWPEALVERILKAGCPQNGVVLDPFMGSGTTALVARRLGRRSIGIELNPEYAQLAARRLQQQSLLA
jgi:DNA modification methylase